jgi:hypothetical protein
MVIQALLAMSAWALIKRGEAPVIGDWPLDRQPSLGLE